MNSHSVTLPHARLRKPILDGRVNPNVAAFEGLMNACVGLDDDERVLCTQANAELSVLRARKNLEAHFLSNKITVSDFVQHLIDLDAVEREIGVRLAVRAERLKSKIIPETRECLHIADVAVSA